MSFYHDAPKLIFFSFSIIVLILVGENDSKSDYQTKNKNRFFFNVRTNIEKISLWLVAQRSRMNPFFLFQDIFDANAD